MQMECGTHRDVLLKQSRYMTSQHEASIGNTRTVGRKVQSVCLRNKKVGSRLLRVTEEGRLNGTGIKLVS